MAQLTLSRLLKNQTPLGTFLSRAGSSLLDEDGALLAGGLAEDEPARFPVVLDGRVIGWVAGGGDPAALAALLSNAAGQEMEKKALAAEVLDRYRELNLLYRLSEILGSSPDPRETANAALTEILRLIPAQSGLVLLKSDQGDIFETAAAWGTPRELSQDNPAAAYVLSSGKPEMFNGVPAGDYFVDSSAQTLSLACAPLQTAKKTLGAILLAGAHGRFFTAGELKLLNTIAQQTAPILEMTRLYRVELEKARLARELQMARQVQESLLPPVLPDLPGWQFSRSWQPYREVAGDFYDVIEEDARHLGLVIADVTDKGMPAALFMAFVRSALRASIAHGDTPARALANANRVICQDSHESLFATLFYARLNTETGELVYVNAGHPPVLHYRRASDELTPLARTGMALGVDIDAIYTQRSIEVGLGDFLLFYTDGIIEAVNAAGHEFGLEQLNREVFNQRGCSAERMVRGLEHALTIYTDPLPVEDDVTLMAVNRIQ